MFHTILMPVDGSPLSFKPLSTVLQLAAAHRARLIFVKVAEPRLFNAGDAEAVHSGDQAEQLRLEQADAELNRAVAAAQDAGLPCEAVLTMSHQPCDEILDTARRYGCDLIAMSTRGKMSVMDTVFGASTTQEVLTKTGIPVLVFPDTSAS